MGRGRLISVRMQPIDLMIHISTFHDYHDYDGQWLARRSKSRAHTKHLGLLVAWLA